MVSRSRASYDLADAPDLASTRTTPARRAFPRAESAPGAQDRTAKDQMLAAQQAFKAATEPELVPNRAAARNSLTIVFLFLAVFLVAAGTSFLQAYLRDHRSAAAGTATREIRVVPSPDGKLAIRSDSQTDRAHVPERAPERSAPQVSTTEPRPRANLPVVSKPFRETFPSRAAVKQTHTPSARSASVNRPSKPIAGPTQARRTPERQIVYGPSLPPVPLNSNGGTQPSLLSHQTLPKAPEPTKSAAQSAKNTPSQANAGTNPAPPGRESASRNVPQSAGATQVAPQPGGVQNSAYVPARPLKWAAPDAKSLGVSRIAQAVDIAVKIRIDESGRVTSAHALLDGAVRDPAVMAAATAAVKQWTFEPAKMQGKNVASEDTVVIHVDPKR